jgi:hypothetical protein
MDALKTALYEIVDSDIPNKLESFKGVYPHYFKDYPRLMQLACDYSINVVTFKQKIDNFLHIKSQMEDNDITREDAEKQIGQSLADEYLPI